MNLNVIFHIIELFRGLFSGDGGWGDGGDNASYSPTHMLLIDNILLINTCNLSR